MNSIDVNLSPTEIVESSTAHLRNTMSNPSMLRVKLDNGTILSLHIREMTADEHEIMITAESFVVTVPRDKKLDMKVIDSHSIELRPKINRQFGL